MKRTTSVGSALLAAMPVLLSAQQTLSVARTHDIAAGVVTLELPGEIRLRVDACSNSSPLIVFYPPYDKTKIGTITCGAQVFDRYQVEKR